MRQEAPKLTSSNPIDPEFNPYPAWQDQMQTSGVVPLDWGLDKPVYMVLGWDLVEQVLRDAETFSSKSNAVGIGQVMGPMIVGMDGEEHRRFRNIVAYAFRPSAMERTEEHVVKPTIHALIDQFEGDGRADLVTQFTSRFPVRIIAAMLGADEGDFDQIHHWTEEINLGPAHEQAFAASAALREFLTPIVEDRKVNPRDDLVSDIVNAEIEGDRLDDEHIYGFLRLLFPAGAETTYRASGTMLAAVLSRPDVLDRVREDRSLITPLIEETLRWETAVTVVSRVTTREVELGGVTLPAGTDLLPSPGSGDRDARHFADPDTWDPDRGMQPNLAFGTGRHQCLGMHLARAEMRMSLEAVIDRLPDVRLDPDSDPPNIIGFAFRGPDHLRVRFGKDEPKS
ncbi:MAG TPA: cytochrome P450 [Acidimicrobiia bacterium]|nr:cytochrome P450 [Acidimicrobiia bacterium]